MEMDNNPRNAVRKLMAIVVETIMEGDSKIGTPGGPLYAALMTTGMTFNSFNSLMEGLVNSGAITKHGQCYKITPLGRSFVTASKRIDSRI